MPADTQQILADAEKLGQLVAQHPAVAKYKDAQRAVANDPDAGRLLSSFDRTLEALGRQEQAGMPVTDAQRQQLEAIQGQLVSHIKIKALNLAQVEFVDLLRKVTQTIQAQVQGQPGGPGGQPGAGGPPPAASRLVV
ncbi:MAG TPA: YlbF family regulator [Humisphaera sp.]